MTTPMPVVATPESESELVARLTRERDAARAENIALRRKTSPASKGIKVSQKGAVSVYGLGRMPTTLYKEQWLKLLAMSDDIRAFLVEHDAELKVKEKKG